MEIELLADAEEDLIYWQKSRNKAVQKKIKQLLADIQQHPYEGVGKPEPLNHSLVGKWSRRINSEHRLIYEVQANRILVYSLKGHYTR